MAYSTYFFARDTIFVYDLMVNVKKRVTLNHIHQDDNRVRQIASCSVRQVPVKRK